MSTIFISYSHDNDDWLKKIETQIRIIKLNSEGEIGFKVWSDKKLDTGDKWEDLLLSVMESAKVAILIVTPNFMASEYIRQKELPFLSQRRQNNGLKVLAVICEPCAWQEDKFLADIQHFPSGKPLSSLDDMTLREELNTFFGVVNNSVRKESVHNPANFNEITKAAIEAPVTINTGELSAVPTLEFAFRHYSGNKYRIALRFSDQLNSDNSRFIEYTRVIDTELLASLIHSVDNYGDRLLAQIAPEGVPKTILEKAISLVKSEPPHNLLRLRIAVKPTARELHLVAWELLNSCTIFQEPFDNTSIVLTRYASAEGENWVEPSIRSKPRTLAIRLLASNTSDQMKKMSTVREKLYLANDSSDADIDVSICENSTTLLELVGSNSGITYGFIDLVLDNDEVSVRIQDIDQNATLLSADELTESFRKANTPYQVLVLDTGQVNIKSENGDQIGAALLTLASLLISTGPCAIITWQSPMEESSWNKFFIDFVLKFSETGNLEIAEHHARNGVGQLEDAWKPVVLTRLRTGKAWYTPQLVASSLDDPWDLIKERVTSGAVIPVIGPGTSQYFMRSRRKIAEELAKRCRFPLASYEQCNLQKVTQYMDTMKERRNVVKEFLHIAREHAIDLYGSKVDGLDEETPIYESLELLWQNAKQKNPLTPYHLLAKLRCPIYLNTNLHNFLSQALIEENNILEGKIRDRIWSVNNGILRAKEDANDMTFNISRDDPLVHYLFGRVDVHSSLALTEDDYFRFLLSFKERWRSLPGKVTDAFSDNALLFLGFDLGDWDFRVIFRAFLELEGSAQLRKIPHVAVQINPDDDRLGDPERTRDYLIAYFKQISEKPLVYIGSAHDFLLEINGLSQD